MLKIIQPITRKYWERAVKGPLFFNNLTTHINAKYLTGDRFCVIIYDVR